MARKYRKHRCDSNCDSLISFSKDSPMEYGPKPIEMSGNDEEPIFGGNSARGLFYKLRLNINDYPFFAIDSDVALIRTFYKI